jgi:uncharacterized membrane protein YcfT
VSVCVCVCVCVFVCVCVYTQAHTHTHTQNRFRAALLPPFFILAGVNTLRVIADVTATVEASRAPTKNGLYQKTSSVWGVLSFK